MMRLCESMYEEALRLHSPCPRTLTCSATVLVCVNRPTQQQQVKDAAFNGLMAQLATKLNLAAHVVGSGAEQTLVHTCADLEGHRGTDGRYYVVDAVHDASSCTTRCCSLTHVRGHSLRHASCHRFHLIEMLPKAPTSHASCGAKRCAPMQCRCHPTPLRGVQRLLLCLVSVPCSPRALVWEQVRRGRCASPQPGGRGATRPVTAYLCQMDSQSCSALHALPNQVRTAVQRLLHDQLRPLALKYSRPDDDLATMDEVSLKSSMHVRNCVASLACMLRPSPNTSQCNCGMDRERDSTLTTLACCVQALPTLP